jgi:hypothetical protein
VLLREVRSVLVNNEIIVIAASLFQLSAMFLKPRCLFFKVADSGPREGVSKDMGERYGQTEESLGCRFDSYTAQPAQRDSELGSRLYNTLNQKA